jgi:hypothetical protein
MISTLIAYANSRVTDSLNMLTTHTIYSPTITILAAAVFACTVTGCHRCQWGFNNRVLHTGCHGGCASIGASAMPAEARERSRSRATAQELKWRAYGLCGSKPIHLQHVPYRR